jgi:hypothetical protein
VTTEKKERSKLGVLMKWVGIGAALLSFGSAIYGVLQTQADTAERRRVVTEQLAASHLQQAAGDYSQAWTSLQKAGEAADADGWIAKLFGGLSAQRREVRAAQEDLAMEWLRTAHAPEGQTFSETVEKPIEVLSADVTTASGERKADLLAHLGWAYFLKQRDGNSQLDPAQLYRDAVAADSMNPYANAFWGHLILWNHGSLADAQQHFASAYASRRAHAVVRHFQLAALSNDTSDQTAEAAWWQVVDEMRKAGETLDADTLRRMSSKYYFALNSDADVSRLLAAIPPADHVELQRLLLQSPDALGSNAIPVKAALAVALEAAGKPDESLATWRDVQASTKGEQLSPTLEHRMTESLKRLGGASAKRR